MECNTNLTLIFMWLFVIYEITSYGVIQLEFLPFGYELVGETHVIFEIHEKLINYNIRQ